MPDEVRHEFEDADSGDEMTLELGVTYTVVHTFVELDAAEGAVEMNGQLDTIPVFTYRVRETLGIPPTDPA